MLRGKNRLWVGLVLALALVVAGSAFAATSKSSAKIVKLSIGAEPPSLDPGLATDTTSSNVLLNIMDPLVRLGPPPALKPVPALASSWTVKGDDVTINLRHDGRWTNGAPVTANDFVWSWLRTISPQLAADYAYQFFGIVGAEAYNSCDPTKADCNALRAKVGISAPNKWTLKVKLISPQPWFIQQIAHTSFLPVNQANVTKFGNKWTEAANIVTDGPFKLVSWKHDASLTLVKNTKWRDAKDVKIDQVQMPIITDAGTALNAYKAGNINVDTTGFNPTDIPALKKLPDWKSFKALGTYYYGFNVKQVPDVNERRAMATVIDRKAIIKYITQTGQQPATGFTPKGIAGGPVIDKDNWLPTIHDNAKAKAFMAKVKNPVKDITLFINNSPGHVQIATAIQAYWKTLGLNVTIRAMDWKQYLQFLGPPPDPSVDVYRNGWIADYPDAYNFLSLWTCNSGNNNTNWCNPKYDALLNKAIHTPDADARTAIYQQAEDLLTGPNGDMPIIPIYWYTFNVLVKPNVHGFFENPMGQWDLSTVTVS
jgi:oligopeptide transport system substrate-binding protein